MIELSIPEPQTVPWLQQFRCMFLRNCKLLMRRPKSMLVMIFGDAAFAVFACNQAALEGFIYPPLTDCGTVSGDFFLSLSIDERSKVIPLLNFFWEGFPFTVLSFGPMSTALFVLQIVHATDFQPQTLSMLRGSGLRESVFWTSWFAPFAIISLINSILGAIASKLLKNCHAYESVFFGGIVWSLFLLHVALISSSLFLAAVAGTSKRCVGWLIVIVMGSSWITLNMYPNFWDYTSTNSTYIPPGAPDYFTGYYTEVESCHRPLVSEFQGNFLKTEEERSQVGSDEFFLGCYIKITGGPISLWNPSNFGFRLLLAALFFVPYFHFETIWSYYLGYTNVPQRKFTARELFLSAETLAVQALPSPPDPPRGDW